MLSKAAVFVTILGLAYSASYRRAWVDQHWESFKQNHGKVYHTPQEDQYRKDIFIQNLHKIAQHNFLYETGVYSYYLGVNHFADLTSEEFLELYTSSIIPPERDNSDFLSVTPPMTNFEKYDDASDIIFQEQDFDLPTEMDWRHKGAVTAVKDQGRCGSCWSFSVTGTLEGQWFKKTKHLVSLSEQNLVDCSSSQYGDYGCEGGSIDGALRYIKDNGGIDSEDNYPYKGHQGNCYHKSKVRAATVKKVVSFTGEDELKTKVAKVGPISVAVHIDIMFQHYKGGILDEPKCGRQINHAVLVVGYGRQNGKDYWLVKNSWGTNWGENGYIRMSRNKNRQCAIGDNCVYPVV